MLRDEADDVVHVHHQVRVGVVVAVVCNLLARLREASARHRGGVEAKLGVALLVDALQLRAQHYAERLGPRAAGVLAERVEGEKRELQSLWTGRARRSTANEKRTTARSGVSFFLAPSAGLRKAEQAPGNFASGVPGGCCGGAGRGMGGLRARVVPMRVPADDTGAVQLRRTTTQKLRANRTKHRRNECDGRGGEGSPNTSTKKTEQPPFPQWPKMRVHLEQ